MWKKIEMKRMDNHLKAFYSKKNAEVRWELDSSLLGL